MQDNEGYWVALARNGDQQAFRHLVNAHARSLFKLCVRITRDVAMAEDAVQETFYSAWKGLSDFGDRAAFSSWLHRIAVNAALQEMRRATRRRLVPAATAIGEDSETDLVAGTADEMPGPELRAEADQIVEHIGRHLDRLSDLERAAFIMKHCEGESLETIGTTLSLNVGQCKQAIFRAVGKLRGALQEWK